MTIGEVLKMLEEIFKFIMAFLSDALNRDEDAEETTGEATA